MQNIYRKRQTYPGHRQKKVQEKHGWKNWGHRQINDTDKLRTRIKYGHRPIMDTEYEGYGIRNMEKLWTQTNKRKWTHLGDRHI